MEPVSTWFEQSDRIQNTLTRSYMMVTGTKISIPYSLRHGKVSFSRSKIDKSTYLSSLNLALYLAYFSLLLSQLSPGLYPTTTHNHEGRMQGTPCLTAQ